MSARHAPGLRAVVAGVVVAGAVLVVVGAEVVASAVAVAVGEADAGRSNFHCS